MAGLDQGGEYDTYTAIGCTSGYSPMGTMSNEIQPSSGSKRIEGTQLS